MLRDKFNLWTSKIEPNAVIRGAQLTFVGAHRALQNPEIFTTEHYTQVAYAIIAGIVIRFLVVIPIVAVKLSLRVISLVYSLDNVFWDNTILEWLNFTGEHILQVPFFLMTVMRYFVPTLDNLFMQSLNWVDTTYMRKHIYDSPNDLRELYYPNLRSYHLENQFRSNRYRTAFANFLFKYARRAWLSIVIYTLSYLPVIGTLVLPMASFYSFKKAAGFAPAALIFGIGILLPRDFLIIFLQTYYSSRNLMRELLEPYFSRVHFTSEEKKNWFRNREGVLFGFALGFYMLMKVPLMGVLIYGIAEASTAYLITKITDPPPLPPLMRKYAISQQTWQNKHQFLHLKIQDIDNIQRKPVFKASMKE